MKKQLFIKLCCGSFIFLYALNTKAQVTFPVNNNLTPGQWVGLLAQPFPLVIAHKGNQPILFLTNNTNRMKLNQTLSYVVSGGTGLQVRDGFMLLSSQPSPTLFAPNFGAFSLLHLNGDDPNLQLDGYRDWMRTGLTFTENNDAMFLGVRRMNTIAGQDDISDMVINWSDNTSFPGGGGGIPDNLVFCFTTGNGTGTSDLLGNTENGRETMRHTTMGYIGIGPRFNNTYQPTSFLHLHKENDTSAWMQITNQYLTQAAPNQTAPTTINWTNVQPLPHQPMAA